jgi:hypothetical protein
MYINKHIILAVATMAILSVNLLFAQTNVKTDTIIPRNHYFVLQVGGGFSTYVSPINISSIGLPNSIKRNSAAFTARLMWYPNHRLRVGFETGYTNLYSYKVSNGNKKGSVNLNAIPLLIVWSMPIVKRVNIFAGFGSYILASQLDYNGIVNSKTFSLGSNIAISYTKPFSKRAGIAAEAKWMNAFETKDAAVSLQLNLIWKFIQL